MLHDRTAQTAVYFALAMGAWAAWNWIRGKGVSPSYFGALVIGELLLIAQDAFGALFLLTTGKFPRDPVHFLYGLLVIVTWPGAYIYTRAGTSRREAGIFALVSFFLAGLSIRAIMTGR